MSVNEKKFGLGRGLDTLLSDDDLNIDDIDGDVDSFINNTVFKDENSGEKWRKNGCKKCEMGL